MRDDHMQPAWAAVLLFVAWVAVVAYVAVSAPLAGQ